tara:strand:+ start:470 stop:1027 length:558 start_codon:yes stop_codon:yes gene_type:complete
MNEKVKERIEEFRKTFSDAKNIVEKSFEKSGGIIQSAIDSNKEAAEIKTIIDTSNDWMLLVKNDAFEKGRKLGYSSASEHMLPVLNQKREMLNQLDDLVNKTLDALSKELNAAIESVQNLSKEKSRVQDQLKDAKLQLQQRSNEVAALKTQLEKLEKENKKLKKSIEEKPKRGRPKKKKEEAPLD